MRSGTELQETDEDDVVIVGCGMTGLAARENRATAAVLEPRFVRTARS